MSALSEAVFRAALEGRATFLPAGARGNSTALILIDGEAVGQAVSCESYVRLPLDATHFGECVLLPNHARFLPDRLRRELEERTS